MTSLLNRYRIGLEISVSGSYSFFNYVNLLHYKCHKINLKSGGSYIDPPDLIKHKNTIKNPINHDDKYFKCAATVALNCEEIRKSLQGI